MLSPINARLPEKAGAACADKAFDGFGHTAFHQSLSRNVSVVLEPAAINQGLAKSASSFRQRLP
jgi:hypothetical protein